MKKVCKHLISTLLMATVLLCVIPAFSVNVKAASGYFQTVKADVPIWSASNSDSTKVRTISQKGTVLYIVSETTNSKGKRWFKLSNGTWVFSGNVESHNHKYSGGICTGIGCGYEYRYPIYSASGTFVVTNTSGAKIWSRPYSNNSTHVFTQNYTTDMTINAYTKNADGNVWYRRTDGRWVFSGNVTQRFCVYFYGNGGSNVPGQQYVLSGNSLKIPTTKPTRTGYVFKGWSTSSSASSASYIPGGSYRFSSNTYLYAVWKACSHSYKGGLCSSCGYEYPLSISSHSATYVVTNSDGAKLWTRPYSNNSNNVSKTAKNTVLTVTHSTKNQEGHTWYKLSNGYWVFSGNVTRRYTISYNANGGKGTPPAQTMLHGKTLTISSQKPTRVGYVFQGWATSSGSSTVSYKSGKAYTFTASKTLYAVWKKCSHSYKGGICSACSYEYPLSISSHSATYVVTNSDGAKLWTRPYSNNSKNVSKAAKNSVLTITHTVKNQEGNTWYKLSNGYWVYSNNVTRRYTISYKANGGKGAPSSQTVLKGKSLTLSSKTPSRVGYNFKGWATSSGTSTVSYKAGSAYKFTASKTLYAVWKVCSHSYKGGICSKCNYEFPLSISAHSATYVVTNSAGAKLWSRPYSNNSKNVSKAAKNSVLTITHTVKNQEGNTWYKLSNGYWIFSDNVTRRYTISYKANGGKSAPSAQTVLQGKKLTISSKRPTRVGYTFQGWATSSTAKKATYVSGDAYKFTASKTLYAVWSTCSHKYSTAGYCTKCTMERPYVVSTFTSPVKYKITVATNAYTRPFTGATAKGSFVVGDIVTASGKTVIGATTWYKLADNNWVLSTKVATATSSELSKVTTVKSISENKGQAEKYLEEKVGDIKRSGLIPGLKKAVTRTKGGTKVTTCSGMIPQGMTFAGDYLLISAYCGCGDKHRSFIYVLDDDTRAYQTTLILDDYCHVGGLAKQGDYVWVCDSGGNSTHKKHLRPYSYQEIAQAVAAKMPYRTLKSNSPQEVATTPSYMCSYNGKLYVGTHYEDTKKATIYYYSVNGSKLAYKGSFVISGVKQIQGIDIRGNTMAITSSLGRYNVNNSKLYLYNFSANTKTYSKPRATYSFANMAEGCYIGSSYIYVICESGAKKYRQSALTRPLDKYVGFSNSALGIKP